MERLKKGGENRNFNFFIVLCLFFFGVISCDKPNPEQAITIDLRLNEDYEFPFFWNVEFENEQVSSVLERRPVKLPSEMSSNAQLGKTFDDIYVLREVKEETETVRVILDSNRNDDLSDEEAFELMDQGKHPVRILRRYKERQERLLPYNVICYTQEINGRQDYVLGIMAHYRLEGVLGIAKNEHTIHVTDSLTDGLFDRRDFSQGTCIRIDINQDGQMEREEYFWGTDIIPIGDDYYEAKDIEEDGRFITFVKTDLKWAKVGEEAPDFLIRPLSGESFRIEDRRGEILLIDFWASWCLPCVSKFPDVKKLHEKFKDEITIIGISIDTESRMGNAIKIIKEYELPWIQVVEGKEKFYPIWQVYSRTADMQAIPLYVLIDQRGVVRYNGRDLSEIESIIAELLQNE